MRAALLVLCSSIGCARAEDPGLEVVRLPMTAYGPFDAAVRIDTPPPPAPKSGPQPSRDQTKCYAMDGDEEDDVMDPPFDNCLRMMEGNPFDRRATVERRARNRDMCCYTGREKRKVITLDPIE